MENELMKQSDVDSLVLELASKTGTPPKHGASATVGNLLNHIPTIKTEDSALPVVKEVSLQDAKLQKAGKGAESEILVSLNEKLAQRLRRVEEKIQQLEQVEKARSGGVETASNEQLQEVVKYVQQLGQEVGNILAKLQGTPGYDAYHTFQCGKCGTREQVASVFKCTNCGHESWLGW